MRDDNSILTISSTVILSLFIFVAVSANTYSATDNSNVVINEVQITDTAAADEFVELYNPTNSPIDMSGWKLVKYTSGGTDANLDSSISGTIQPNSYYLIANSAYTGSVVADEQYSANSQNIPSNGGVRLLAADESIVDTLGLGTGLIFETQTVDNPVSGGSVTRTNAIDTDNNFNDFSQLEVSDPQNAASSSATPTPTATPTESPTPTPEPTATASATPTASPTAEPTDSPTPSPSASPTAEPTESPSPTSEPTESPTPSPSSSPSPTESPTPEPTSTPRPPVRTRFLARFGSRVCRLEYRYVNFGFFRRIAFPRIVCN